MRQTPQNMPCHLQLWLAMVGFLPLLVLCTVTEFDLWLAAQFYKPEIPSAWFIADAAPWSWLYRYGEYPAFVMLVVALLVLLGSLRQHTWARYRRRCLFLVLVVALGPGLLVNGLLKPAWSRPRPRQIEQFGGSYSYRPWWRPGGLAGGKSFPSGHTAMGYALVAGAMLIPCRQRAWPHDLALAGTLAYGTLMGVARIVQGGHFASDVVWTGGLMCIIVLGLQKALGIFPSDVRHYP
ncbi:MAG TPA: phosphatase PAP2 family protein [Candidatus Tectomicrobia bacterium]|jgi:membrane-associated PAP2 superfamily phosphatase